MRYVFIPMVLCILACGRGKKYHDTIEQTTTGNASLDAVFNFQKELNLSFTDPETSPLPDRYRANFNGLDFFSPDTSFRVIAKLKRTPDAVPFQMPSTTGDSSTEVVYGIATFIFKDAVYELEIYRSLDLEGKEGYESYLFLPFYDATNGLETYGGGRYIDLSIPQKDQLIIDFNKAYNPYCVYNKKYSCPIVPRVNTLPFRVLAGVKDFKPIK